ncbi:unnamed protein product [Adineta ricciae]|uniref:Uncharacterized protein n=1 Tax=Adineta ricciae TaxID=249248 RepID=A0A816ANF7_ADIRI|nr:unnamed protein product [Adineta ricciae]CAF1597823.1 unnamed protein product [Adineta ricciae]
MMLPVTSRGVVYNQSVGILLSNLPLAHSFIPTLVKTAEDQYEYRLYIGYDYGDSWYDNISNWQHLSDFIRLQLKANRSGLRVTFRGIRLHAMEQRLTPVWNTLAQVAQKDQCDYFYPANDDMQLLTKGWTSAAVEALRSCPVASNFGIAAFKDVGVCMVPTFHLVHKTHLELHGGIYYPVPSHGAGQDPWIFAVYRPWKCAFHLKQYEIKNHIGLASGPRYKYVDAPQFGRWIQRGRQELYNRLSLSQSLYNQSFVNSSQLNFDIVWDLPC